MSATEAQTLAEMIEEITDPDALAIVERAVWRTRSRIAQAEQAERDADPVEQERRRQVLAEYEATAQAEADEFQRREKERADRLANAEVIGTFRFEKIRPQYLVGKTVDVIGVNDTTYRANVPDTAEFKTWRGRKGIRVPKTSGTFVAGTRVF